jgi:hypothetical protein
MSDFLVLVIVVLLAGSVGFMALVLGLRVRNAARWGRELVALSLRFPRGMEAEAVAAFFTGLSGLAGPWWRRLVTTGGVMVETSATARGIAHHLLVPRPSVPVVLAMIRAAMPGVGVREDEDYAPHPPTRAVELGLSNALRPLSVDKPALVSGQMLASLQPLSSGERLVVQWWARPVGPVSPVPPPEPPAWPGGLVEQLVWGALSGPALSADDARAARAKAASPQFVAVARIGVTAAGDGRARQLLGRVLPAFRAISGPGASFYRRRLPGRMVVRGVAEHRPAVVT